MSKLLSLINRLKAQASENMLTASQTATFTELDKRWRYPDRINLCGPAGSGKTFLGWIMARRGQTGFYASPKMFEQDLPLYTPELIIDNVSTEEKRLRRLFSEIQLRHVEKVLLITRKPIKIGLPVVALPFPTKNDVNQIYQNLDQLQFHPTQPVSDGDFWKIIYSVL